MADRVPVALRVNLPVASLIDVLGWRRLAGFSIADSYRAELAAIRPGAFAQPSVDEPSVDEPSDDEPSVDEPSDDEPSDDELSAELERAVNREAWGLIGAACLLLGIGAMLAFVGLLSLGGVFAVVAVVPLGVNAVLAVNSVLLGGFTPRFSAILWARSRRVFDVGWLGCVGLLASIEAYAFYLT